MAIMASSRASVAGDGKIKRAPKKVTIVDDSSSKGHTPATPKTPRSRLELKVPATAPAAASRPRGADASIMGGFKSLLLGGAEKRGHVGADVESEGDDALEQPEVPDEMDLSEDDLPPVPLPPIVPAEKRYRPDILHTSPEFIDIHAIFAAASAHPEAVDIIVISTVFDEFEQRLLAPSRDDDTPDIVALRHNATLLYHHALENQFKDVLPDLPFKLTLRYFGLPVEPVMGDESWQVHPAPDGDLLPMDVPMESPEKPPLGFLAEWKRVKQIIETEEGQDGTEKQKAAHPSDEFVDFKFTRGHLVGVKMRRLKAGDSIQYLYGRQGRVAFCPDKVATFAEAVRRLLGLRWLDTAKYTLLRYTAKKGTTKAGTANKPTARMVDGNLSLSLPLSECQDALPGTVRGPAWRTIRAHRLDGTHKPSADGEPCCYFFVRRVGESDPDEIRPDEMQPGKVTSHNSNVTAISRKHPDVPGVVDQAYLRFPELGLRQSFDASQWGSNHYSQFVREALNVLLPLPTCDTRVFHRGAFSLVPDSEVAHNRDPNVYQDRIRYRNRLAMYGLHNIGPGVLARMHPRRGTATSSPPMWWLEDSSRDMDVTLTTPGRHEIVFSLPGTHSWRSNSLLTNAMYHYINWGVDLIGRRFRPIANEEVPDTGYFGMSNNPVDCMTAILRETLLDYRDVDLVRIWTADAFYNQPKDLRRSDTDGGIPEIATAVMPGPRGGSSSATQSFNRVVMNALAMDDPLIVLQPLWKCVTILAGWDPHVGLKVDFASAWESWSVARFRTVVDEMARMRPYEGTAPPSDMRCIRIQQRRMVRQNEGGTPAFVVTPETTEREWRVIRRSIVTNTIKVTLHDLSTDWVRQSLPNEWGARYGVVDQWRWLMAAPKPSFTVPEEDDDHNDDDDDFANDLPPPRSREDRQPLSLYPEMIFSTGVFAPSLSKLGCVPMEPFLRVGPRAPKVSKAVMTPTEQAWLESAFVDVHNIALGRVWRCPMRSCQWRCRVGDESATRAHLRGRHGRELGVRVVVRKGARKNGQNQDEDEDRDENENQDEDQDENEDENEDQSEGEGENQDGNQKDARQRGTRQDDDQETEPAPPRPRRAASPDWNDRKLLGPPPASFTPSDDMYCTRCLRKVPKTNTKDPSADHGIPAHAQHDRSCRVRWGRGSCGQDEGIGLPNRSGFVTMAEIRTALGSKNSALAQIKKAFHDVAPQYKDTMYPIGPYKGTASMWEHDPNNDTNKKHHGLPWPPYLGDQELPEDGGKGKKATPTKRKSKGVKDSSYQPGKDNREDDEDETSESEEASGGKKRKRKSGDPTFKPVAPGGGGERRGG